MRIADWIRLGGLVMSVSLAGCATGAPAPAGMTQPPVMDTVRPGREAALASPQAGLPPQTLADGACASFFWTADDAHRLVGFENETEGFARFHAMGAEHGFYTPVREGGYVAGDALQRVYTDPDRQLDIRLSGTMGEGSPSGQRIERAVMRVVQPNGRTLVIPVMGLYACRGAGEAPR